MSAPDRNPSEPIVIAIDRTMKAVWRFLLYAAIIVGVIYAAYRLKAIIVSIFIAAIVAYIVRPISDAIARSSRFANVHRSLWRFCTVPFRINRHSSHATGVKVSKLVPSHHTLRLLATIYVFILMGLGIWYSGRLLINPFIIEFRNFSHDWPKNQKRLESYASAVNTWYRQHVSPNLREKIQQQLNKNRDNFSLSAYAGKMGTVLAQHLADLVRNIVDIVMLPVLAFFFVLDSRRIKHEFAAILPKSHRHETLRMLGEFNRIMHSFVVGQAVLCLIAGVVVGFGLWLLGVKYSVTLGVLAGVTRAVPIIGPVIGAIPIILLVLISRGFGVALAVLIFFTLLQFAESKFIMPLLIGDRLNLHPVIIIIVLLIGGEFAGLLGMFFAAPVAAMIRVMIQKYWVHGRMARIESKIG